MAPKSQKFNISLPHDLVKKVDAQAKKEYRTRSEVIREALRSYLSNNDPARSIHSLAEDARRHSHFDKALELIDQALVAYQKEQDILGFAEALASKVITLRQLYDQSKNSNYLILAKHTADSAVEIARQSGNKQTLALPLENLAKIFVDMQDFDQAAKAYKEALENMEQNPFPIHDRPAYVDQMKAKYQLCLYLSGKKEALREAEKLADKIMGEKDPSEQDKEIWAVITYISIAEAASRIDPTSKDLAKQVLGKALKIASKSSSEQLIPLKEKVEKKLEELK